MIPNSDNYPPSDKIRTREERPEIKNRRQIYDEIIDWLVDKQEYIILGDFNETRSDIDRGTIEGKGDSEEEKPQQEQIKEKWINNIITNLKAVDVYREIHPKEPGFTYFYKSGPTEKGSRLDHILLSAKLWYEIRNPYCDTQPIVLSDHHMVAFTGTHSWRRDRGKYKIRGQPWGIPVPIINFDKQGKEINTKFARFVLEYLEEKFTNWWGEIYTAHSCEKIQTVCLELTQHIRKIAKKFYKFRGGGKHLPISGGGHMAETTRRIRAIQKS